MQASIACVLGLVNAICIAYSVVSMSDSESVGPGSIPGGRKLNFFSPFFLLEVINGFFLLFFSSFQSRMIYQNKSEKL